MVEHGNKMIKADHCRKFTRKILGIEIVRDRNENLYLYQENYVEKVLRHFGMDKGKAASIPFSHQLCPSTNEEKFSIKNISHVMGMVCLYLSNPGIHHWETVKWVMRYLCGSSNLRLTLGCNKPMFVGYMDSDLAGSLDDQKSTSGNMVTLSGESWLGNQNCKSDALDSKLMEIEKIHTDDNGSDMLTLWRGKFEFCRTVAGLVLL
ncbi:hypothetical protein LIER_01305 [Lithospermum erythrorhizon]|uniref:Reverse transcriptase Ty1/copia-type domain-containing protein n=1 Tax=Lithospermum erythrorhizon TaxID=34254 RepID=A0AAV3NP39_LITER